MALFWGGFILGNLAMLLCVFFLIFYFFFFSQERDDMNSLVVFFVELVGDSKSPEYKSIKMVNSCTQMWNYRRTHKGSLGETA